MYNLKTSERVLYGDTYLIISLEGKSLIPYQEDMLYENHLPGYLGFYTKFENETFVFYNITNCVSLSDFIGGRKLTRRQYLMIIDAVVDAMILRDQYFLSVNSLLIHQNYIYIKDNSEIVLAYLPAEVDIDSKQALREFAAWLTTKLDVSEPGASESSIPLQLMINNPSLNLKFIKEAIIQILSGSPQEMPQKTRTKPREYINPNQINIPDEPPANRSSGRQKNDNKVAGASKKYDANLFGIGERKKNSIAKPEKARDKTPKKRPARDGYADKTPAAVKSKNEGYYSEQQPQYNSEDQRIYSISTDILKEYAGGLSENIQVIVYLLYKPATPEERIIQVDRSPFIIGRGENSNFQINDISISREHAKIGIDGNKVYLIDTKSKFGTYVNDIRIKPDTAVEIKDDDSIMFSGLIFTVKIVRMDDIYTRPPR